MPNWRQEPLVHGHLINLFDEVGLGQWLDAIEVFVRRFGGESGMKLLHDDVLLAEDPSTKGLIGKPKDLKRLGAKIVSFARQIFILECVTDYDLTGAAYYKKKSTQIRAMTLVLQRQKECLRNLAHGSNAMDWATSLGAPRRGLKESLATILVRLGML